MIIVIAEMMTNSGEMLIDCVDSELVVAVDVVEVIDV